MISSSAGNYRLGWGVRAVLMELSGESGNDPLGQLQSGFELSTGPQLR